MKINLILISIAFCTIVYGQSNEIGIMPFKIEKNAETHNNHYEPKFMSGLYYQRIFARLHWITAIEYGENSIDDGCNSCVDHVSGTGLFKELNFNTGIGMQWFRPLKHGGFQFLTRLKATAMAYNYAGDFSGGWSGTSYNEDRRYYLLGGELEIGFAYSLPSNFVFRLDAGIRIGNAWSKNRYPLSSPLLQNISASSYLPKLSIGYRF